MSEVTSGLSFGGVLVIVGLVAGLFGFAGFMSGRDYETELTSHGRECWGCGQTQTCVFGPGIVGAQACDVPGKWGRCEPVKAPTK